MRFKIDKDFSVRTDLLTLTFSEEAGRKVAQSRMNVEEGKGTATILLPEGLNYSDSSVQEWLNRVVVETLRWFCPRLVAPRIQKIAKEHGFSYKRLTFKDVSTRWGSCSSKCNINLSLWLLLAPSRLVDYVLKHELSHLRHMDHSAAFWAEVDKMCGGEGTAKVLDKEMNAFSKGLRELGRTR